MKGLWIAILIFVCSYPACADQTATMKAISAQYALYDKACVKGMSSLADWCEENLTADFTMKASGGTMDRKQFVSMCRAMAKNPDPTWGGIKSQKITIDKLKVTDSEAVAEVTSRGTAVMKAAKGNKGHKSGYRTVQQVQHFRETWVMTGGAWKIHKSELLGSGSPNGVKKGDPHSN